MASLVKTILKFSCKEDALKLHLLAVTMEEGIKLSLGDIDVIIEIYKNGYNKDTFKNCVDQGFYKSEQTVRNSVAKSTKYNILMKTRGDRKVNSKFLPVVNDDLIFNYQVFYDITKP